MGVVRRTGLSKSDQVILSEALNMLNMHTVSNIMTVDDNHIKQDFLTVSLTYRKSTYWWTRDVPWESAHKKMMECLIKYLAISTE